MYKRNRISDQEYRDYMSLIMRNLNYANKYQCVVIMLLCIHL